MVKKRVRWQNIRQNKCSLISEEDKLKEDKFEADFSQALQKRGLAATGSNVPPANTFIPTLCRCSHSIPSTLCFLSQEGCTAHSLGKRQNSQTWGKSPMQHSADAGICPSLHSRAHQTWHAQHHWDPASLAAPRLGTALISQDYTPNLQQHKHHLTLLGTDHVVRYWKPLPKKIKRKPGQSTPSFLHRRHSRITREDRDPVGAKCNYSFPLELWREGKKKRGHGLSDTCAESTIAPTFSESHRSVWVLCFWNKSTVKASLFTLDTVQRLIFLK